MEQNVNRTVKKTLSFLFFFFLFQVTPVLSGTQPGKEKAPDFELKDINGEIHRLADYRGKVILINFWASWCPECIAEMPALEALYRRMKGKNIVVLGITIDRDKAAVLKALNSVPVTYPIMMDTKGDVFVKRFTVIGLPTTFIVDGHGYLRETLMGSNDFDSPDFMEKILALPGAAGTK